jgi:hypothetical protein
MASEPFEYGFKMAPREAGVLCASHAPANLSTGHGQMMNLQLLSRLVENVILIERDEQHADSHHPNGQLQEPCRDYVNSSRSSRPASFPWANSIACPLADSADSDFPRFYHLATLQGLHDHYAERIGVGDDVTRSGTNSSTGAADATISSPRDAVSIGAKQLVMPARISRIPQYRERAALQSIKFRSWVPQAALHPAGEGTIASMLRKGWIEQQLGPGGALQFRITEVGKVAIAAKIPTGPSTR